MVPVLVRKLPSPEYTAVIVCDAVDSVEILPEVALPLDNDTGEPKLVPSILNCTVPAVVPAPGDTAATVAVKVTGWPKTDGLRDGDTVVVVAAWLTVCDRADDALSLKLVSPPYSAVMV